MCNIGFIEQIYSYYSFNTGCFYSYLIMGNAATRAEV